MSGGLVRIRPEKPEEAGGIGALIAAAFAGRSYSDGTEAALVERLRDAGALVLSLVAVGPGGAGRSLLGQVAASPVQLGAHAGWVGIGPLAVHPEHQQSGIGSALMLEALARLRGAGFAGVVLVGNPGYYQRFGILPHAGLVSPAVPDRNVMGLGFGAEPPQGVIRWHPAFGEG